MPTGRGVFVGGNPDGAYPLRGKLPFLLWESGMCLPYSWFLPARPGTVFPFARLGPQPGRWRQAVSWRLCRLETARTLWVLCRLTDGAGKTVFSFVGKWCVLSCSCFLLAQQGPKPLFLLRAKEKAVLDSEKEKGGPVEMITGDDTTGRWCCAVMVSLG